MCDKGARERLCPWTMLRGILVYSFTPLASLPRILLINVLTSTLYAGHSKQATRWRHELPEQRTPAAEIQRNYEICYRLWCILCVYCIVYHTKYLLIVYTRIPLRTYIPRICQSNSMSAHCMYTPIFPYQLSEHASSRSLLCMWHRVTPNDVPLLADLCYVCDIVWHPMTCHY